MPSFRLSKDICQPVVNTFKEKNISKCETIITLDKISVEDNIMRGKTENDNRQLMTT